jgi:hypothetical protein
VERLLRQPTSEKDTIADLEFLISQASESMERQAAVLDACASHALAMMDFLQDVSHEVQTAVRWLDLIDTLVAR